MKINNFEYDVGIDDLIPCDICIYKRVEPDHEPCISCDWFSEGNEK